MTAPDATALRIAADLRAQRDREADERLRGLMARWPA